ncbi:MAG TPA: hypothetical protein PKM13_00695 [Candidatus Bipolaricaulis anaerobius]|nr:hypothetical protein [Candidatus Bipolaricaulis anaerobius]
MASTVAVRLAEQAGVTHLRLVYFRSPFFLGEEGVGLRAQRSVGGRRFQSITLKRDFLALGQRGSEPSFPCGACRRLLLDRVGRLVRRLHADLVVTGEVVGKGGLGVEELVNLDRAAGLAGRVLRPLSARLLPPTHATGKVGGSVFQALTAGDGLAGTLAALARELGLVPWEDDRECLLTDGGLVRRLRDVGSETPLTENLVQLLRFEHFYQLGREAQVVVARTAEEQTRLQPLFLPSDVRLYVQIPRSPLALVRAPWMAKSPDERAWIIAAAAERMAEAAGLPRAPAWVVRFRCELEAETHQMRLPIDGRPAPALILS